MKTVAVTGGIGSGKSTVCRLLSSRGIPVYDCDSSAKGLYDREPSLAVSLEKLFGCSLRNADGSLDRGLLASLIFTSPERLAALESIVHPAVLKDFLLWKDRVAVSFADRSPSDMFFGHRPFAVMESAIILSKPEFLRLADLVVLVDADEDSRLSRVCLRDGTVPEKVRQRMSVQSFDLSRVDAIIRNDGSEQDLEKKVNDVFSSFTL